MDKKFCIIGGYVLLVTLVLGWGLFVLGKHVIVAVDKWGDAAPALTGDVHNIQQSLAPMPELLTAATGTLDQATTTLQTTNTTIAKFQPVIAHLDATVVSFNRPCNTKNAPGPFHTAFYSEDSVMPCGMFADTARTLEQIRVAAGTVVVAGNHEDKNLGQWDDVATHFNTLLLDSDDDATDLDTFLDTLPEISGNVNVITKNFAATTTDFQTKFHSFLYPPPCRTASCRWIEAYRIAVGASKFMEPAYFGIQAVQSVH